MPVIVVQENIEIKRTIRRLAHEIIENNQGTSELILVGILTRGATLAERIATEIENFEGMQKISKKIICERKVVTIYIFYPG